MIDQIYVTDIETTGIADDAEIVEIGAVRWDHPQPDLKFNTLGQGWGHFSQLCKPSIPIPPETSAIHHITDWHVKNARSADEVFTQFLSDLPERIVMAAHNAAFEQRFLTPLAPAHKIDWICTYKLALRLYPDAPSHKNAALFYHLGLFDCDPEKWDKFFTNHKLHRAWPDALITSKLLGEMLKEVSIDEAIQISNKPALLPKVYFGKYRGQKWIDMDEGYLNWVLRQDFDENVMFTAQHTLDQLNQEEGA